MVNEEKRKDGEFGERSQFTTFLILLSQFASKQIIGYVFTNYVLDLISLLLFLPSFFDLEHHI
jgi:hypothetical protein